MFVQKITFLFGFIFIMGCELNAAYKNVNNSNVAAKPNKEFTVLTERFLDADGEHSGLSAYELIRKFGGKNAIEAPDLYPENHPEERHIHEAYDSEVGNHFVFTLHRDDDIDRDRVNLTDRQRNEIKAYSKSEKALKGYEGETFEYRWKFKVDANFSVSKKFTHLFQLKSVDNGIGTPLLALTARTRKGQDVLEVAHVPVNKRSTLASTALSNLRDEWISVTCQITYGERGHISLVATRLSDQLPIFNVDAANIDTWRGTENKHFVRPKWGLLRSLADAENLRAGEETVRFANFVVRQLH